MLYLFYNFKLEITRVNQVLGTRNTIYTTFCSNIYYTRIIYFNLKIIPNYNYRTRKIILKNKIRINICNLNKAR